MPIQKSLETYRMHLVYLINIWFVNELFVRNIFDSFKYCYLTQKFQVTISHLFAHS